MVEDDEAVGSDNEASARVAINEAISRQAEQELRLACLAVVAKTMELSDNAAWEETPYSGAEMAEGGAASSSTGKATPSGKTAECLLDLASTEVSRIHPTDASREGCNATSMENTPASQPTNVGVASAEYISLIKDCEDALALFGSRLSAEDLSSTALFDSRLDSRLSAEDSPCTARIDSRIDSRLSAEDSPSTALFDSRLDSRLSAEDSSSTVLPEVPHERVTLPRRPNQFHLLRPTLKIPELLEEEDSGIPEFGLPSDQGLEDLLVSLSHKDLRDIVSTAQQEAAATHSESKVENLLSQNQHLQARISLLEAMMEELRAKVLLNEMGIGRPFENEALRLETDRWKNQICSPQSEPQVQEPCFSDRVFRPANQPARIVAPISGYMPHAN